MCPDTIEVTVLRLRPKWLAFLALTAGSSSSLSAQARDSVLAVDTLFSRVVAVAPGCAVAVSRGGRTLLSRAYGRAHLEHDAAFTIDTPSEAGSVSKQFVAASLMLLANDGKIALSDPVRKYIPELPDYGVPLTLAHLLSHTSGVRDWSSLALMSGWPVGTRLYSEADALEMIARQRELNFRPGAEFSYSNSNYVLAAVIVERVSGVSLQEFTKRRLFDPLRMAHTSWRDDQSRVVKGRATAYAPDGNGWRQSMPFQNVYGPGGLITTVGDLLVWNDALTANTILERATVDAMETPPRLASGRTSRYGLGLWIMDYKGVREVQHEGGTTGYRAFLARYPLQQLSVALLCNDASVNPTALGHSVADVFLSGLTRGTPASIATDAPVFALTSEQLSANAGLYRELATGEPLRLSAGNGAWHFANSSFFGSDDLRPTSPNTFTFPGGVARGDFVSDPQSGAKLFRVWSSDGMDTTVHERVDEWRPTVAELGAYVARYMSDEANGDFSIALDSGALSLTLAPGKVSKLTSVYRDTFTSRSLGRIRFVRKRNGRIDGLTLTNDRVRNVRFRRLSSTTETS